MGTFYSIGVQHNDIKPSGVASLEEFEKLLVNVIEGINVKEDDVRALGHPMSSGLTQRNWTAINIPTVFHLLPFYPMEKSTFYVWVYFSMK